MNEIVKVCKKHGDLTLKDLKIGIYKGKKYRKCKKCENDRSSVYREKIRSNEILHKIAKQKDRDYWDTNKEKIKQKRIENLDSEKRREQYKRYASKYRKHCNEKQKEYRDNLSDSYIRRLIQNGDKNIPLMSIPESMLKLKRALMLAKRFMRNHYENKKHR